MLRIFIAHVVAEAIRQTALVIAPDLHPAACLAVAVAAGVLVERALTHPSGGATLLPARPNSKATGHRSVLSLSCNAAGIS